MKPKCVILIGCPGAGKSTFVEQMPARSEYHVLSSDNLIEQYASDRGKTYDQVFQQAVKQANKQVFEDAHRLKNLRENVIVDRTNMTKAARKKFIDIFKDTHEIVAVVFKVPENLQERLDGRIGKTIPAHVISNMISSFEYPEKEEGFDQIF